MQLLLVKHIKVCRTLYECFFCLYMQQEMQEMLRRCISILWRQFFLILCLKFFSVILRNFKSQIDFTFYVDVALDLPKQFQCLADQTKNCLENVYLKVVAQSSPMKKVFLKTLKNLENTCAGSLQLY